MSENENQQSTIASNLCKNGCGFYGSTQFDGMCSVCHKENMKKKQKQDEEQIQNGKQSPSQHPAAFCPSPAAFAGSVLLQQQSPASTPSATPLLAGGQVTVPLAAIADAGEGAVADNTAVAVSVAAADAAAAAATVEAGGGRQKRSRCGVCKKKVGLTGFNCRCGGLFCSLHRYSDKHTCDFDYQSLGQQQIRKANPQVVSNKIDKL